MHQWGVGLCCLPRVRHRGQRLVVDVDRVRRVRGRVGVGGNDRGDALPLESDHLLGEHPVNRTGMPGRTQFVGSGDTASSRSAPVTTVTTPGILTRTVHRNRPDPGMRVRAAQQGDVQQCRPHRPI